MTTSLSDPVVLADVRVETPCECGAPCHQSAGCARPAAWMIAPAHAQDPKEPGVCGNWVLAVCGECLEHIRTAAREMAKLKQACSACGEHITLVSDILRSVVPLSG